VTVAHSVNNSLGKRKTMKQTNLPSPKRNRGDRHKKQAWILKTWGTTGDKCTGVSIGLEQPKRPLHRRLKEMKRVKGTIDQRRFAKMRL